MACNCNEQGKTINIGMGCCVPIVANADAYYTKSEIDEKLDDIVISGGGITSGEVQSMIDKSISGYVATSEFTQYIQNLQDQIAQLQIEISGCCGGSGETQTRWITMTGENDYSCNGTTKYTKEKEQTSTDGVNWVDTGNYRQGSTIIEENSVDCGYVPATFKWLVTYQDGYTESAECYTNIIQYNEINKKHSTYNVESVEIGNCVTIIGNSAFINYFYLHSITIPNSVTTIGNDAFILDGLRSINIPDSVTSIGEKAFKNCHNAKNLTIGSGVTYIGNEAFLGCSGLTSIRVEATTPPTLGSDAFNDTNNCPIYVPAASVDAYKSASIYWSECADRIYPIT